MIRSPPIHSGARKHGSVLFGVLVGVLQEEATGGTTVFSGSTFLHRLFHFSVSGREEGGCTPSSLSSGLSSKKGSI